MFASISWYVLVSIGICQYLRVFASISFLSSPGRAPQTGELQRPRWEWPLPLHFGGTGGSGSGHSHLSWGPRRGGSGHSHLRWGPRRGGSGHSHCHLGPKVKWEWPLPPHCGGTGCSGSGHSHFAWGTILPRSGRQILVLPARPLTFDSII